MGSNEEKSSYMCLHQEGINSIPKLIERAYANNYNVVLTSVNANMLPFEPFESDPTYPGTVISAIDWNSKVILKLSDVAVDSPNPKLREHSKTILLRDIIWAEHLQNVGNMLIRIRGDRNEHLAEILGSRKKGFWLLQIPITNPELTALEHHSDTDEAKIAKAEQVDTWCWWNNFRFAVNQSSRVKVVLELNDSNIPNRETVRRWLGEPIEAIMIPSSLFVLNRSNYYVLRKEWQVIIGYFISVRANIIISTNPNDKAISQYSEYLKMLINENADTHPLTAYENMLEIPLQPLSDNLDSYTYEVFETDPIKYKYYQLAVQQALIDRVPEAEASTKMTVVMVLGGGRGPLARAVFNAAEQTKRKIRVYIIEKNPSAIRTLSNMVKTLWSKKDVHIFSKDMRHMSPPELADILVSELLGSIGDNELSPECLDGASKLLKEDGISIPCKSTSYINPIMSAILYNNLCQLETKLQPFNFGYVVLLKNIYHIDEPQALFEFTHPNRDVVRDNERYKQLTFTAKCDCVLHGFGGYFDTVLYKNIVLSINPLTHTQGMFSWFPMFFPTPTKSIKAGEKMSIKFWRRVDDIKVWYEWQVCEPCVLDKQNKEGIGYNMRL